MKLAYQFASREELDLIHTYTLKLLKDTGVMFFCDEAVEVFKSRGFRTDGFKVFIEEEQLQKALQTIPKTYEWHGRNGSITFGDGKTIFAPCYGPMYVLENNEFHTPTPLDFASFSKLDQTSKVIGVGNPNMMDMPLIEPDKRSNFAMAASLMYLDKPLLGMVNGKKSARDSIQMARDFYGLHNGEVVVSGMMNVASPLHYSEAMCEALIEYAKEGQPALISSAGMSGMTAPDTIASTILISNAEILAGVVFVQLINPGNPTVYGIQNHGSDLRYSVATSGSPEQSLVFLTGKALAGYYGMPVRTGGLYSDSKDVDIQAGVEAFNGGYAAIMSGADIMLHACGILDSANSMSYEKYVYDEEIIQSIQRFVRGYEVSETTLCFDKIVQAGPGGNFLGRTSKLYRNDYYMPNLPNRIGHGSWVEAGKPSVKEKCREAYKDRIESYVMPEMDEAQKKIVYAHIPEEFRYQ
jgi:trimethylamine--corrinoid protein Co-methyltransferase